MKLFNIFFILKIILTLFVFQSSSNILKQNNNFVTLRSFKLKNTNFQNNNEFNNEFNITDKFLEKYNVLDDVKKIKLESFIDNHNIPINDMEFLDFNTNDNKENKLFYFDKFNKQSKHDSQSEKDSQNEESFKSVFNYINTLWYKNKNKKHDIDEQYSRFNKKRRSITSTVEKYLSNGLPILHSNKGSSNILYLDFDGHINPSDSAWGYFSAMPFDPSENDVSHTNPIFDEFEQYYIFDIWQRMSEDFAPFNIDVTTEEPNTFTSTTAHCLFTNTNQSNGNYMPEYNAGGVAYLDVFGESFYDYYSPALVFWNNLYNTADCADAGSHEIGHNLGLSHDGTNSQAYYNGDGDDSTFSWAPIMGAGYNNRITQWSKGQYNNANNQENDLDIIKNKLSYRQDDYPDSILNSYTINIVNNKFNKKGIIEKNTDKDFFKFVLDNESDLEINISPLSLNFTYGGYNLDIGSKLYNSDYIVIHSFDSSNLELNYKARVNKGNYYLRIYGNSHHNGKYTNYGSLGQYFISGEIIPYSTTTETTTTITTTTPSQTTTTPSQTTTTTVSRRRRRRGRRGRRGRGRSGRSGRQRQRRRRK